MSNWVSEQPIQAWSLIADYQSEHLSAGHYGAAATFVGTMRDFSTRDNLSKMVLEHYPEMTALYLDKLEKEARNKWPVDDCLIVHRVGDLFPADDIVVIACWSAHRRAALDACNWLIEELKYRAPFWKQEFGPDGAQWVTENTDGTA
jgi:molybdopterin synthase catalytic subunit